jgi:hypothetical protein
MLQLCVGATPPPVRKAQVKTGLRGAPAPPTASPTRTTSCSATTPAEMLSLGGSNGSGYAASITVGISA